MRVLFVVTILSVAGFLALFAGRIHGTFAGNHADPEMRHATRIPAGYVAGVRQAWAANYAGVFDDEPTGMVVDSSGNVYVTGYTSIPDYSAYVTVKYNASGEEEWSAGYNPPNGSSSAAAIAVDHSGNVYVTGTSGTFGSADS